MYRPALTTVIACAALLQACTTLTPASTPSSTPSRSQCEALVGAASQAVSHPQGATHAPEGTPLQPLDSADAVAWVRQTRRAADQLACSIPFQYRGEGPILMATLVELNSMKSDAQFGRAVAEQLGNRLARLGYPIVEMRLRDAINVQDRVGELMLSRQAQELAKAHKTPLAIVGTYIETLSHTVVNVRAVRVADGVVITSADFAIPNDANVQNMLASAAGVSKEARDAARPVQMREFKVRP
jgi:hypothetical protein